jgi:ABC-2 type transport system ATP-binding protein
VSLIEVQDLTKIFKQPVKKSGLTGAIGHLFTQKYVHKTAVDNINLKINEGESIAYLGPNGAGKSTTIKMLTGILVPTHGEIRVNGLIPHQKREENSKIIGVVFGQRTQLWWDLPVIESLNLLKEIYEIPQPIFKKNMEVFVELLGMADFLHLSARKISLGQRMRADLAAALLHNPKIVYLDEPTIGLDIAVKKRIREFIKHINAEYKTTIMLTTHDMDDIESICNKIIIIDHGRIIYEGDIEELKNAYLTDKTIHITLETKTAHLRQSLDETTRCSVVNEEDNAISVRFNRFDTSSGEVLKQVMKHAEVLDFHIDEPKIEDIIYKVYNRELHFEQKMVMTR